jgi:hypothetical protein
LGSNNVLVDSHIITSFISSNPKFAIRAPRLWVFERVSCVSLLPYSRTIFCTSLHWLWQEEEEQLLSAPKEESLATEAARRIAQEEEEKLFLRKGLLLKKMAEIS